MELQAVPGLKLGFELRAKRIARKQAGDFIFIFDGHQPVELLGDDMGNRLRMAGLGVLLPDGFYSVSIGLGKRL